MVRFLKRGRPPNARGLHTFNCAKRSLDPLGDIFALAVVHVAQGPVGDETFCLRVEIEPHDKANAHGTASCGIALRRASVARKIARGTAGVSRCAHS